MVEWTLPEPWPGRVHGGAPAIELQELDGFPEVQSGDAVSLRDQEGRQVGIGIADPANGVLRTLPAAPMERLDDAFFQKRIQAAAQLRRRLGLVGPQSAYRLINAEGDGLSGMLVEIYAEHALIYTYSDAYDAYLPAIATALESELGVRSVIQKERPPGGPPSGRVPFSQLTAEVPPRELHVVENGLLYEVHLQGGVNTGLFCDMRDVRRAFASFAPGRRVLNTFAYTGSFSVVAAKAGAKTVTTIDFASGVLQWAKTNFKLNDLSTSRHPFVRGDVFEYLKNARRKGETFDAIILDPPATTTVPGRRWFLKSDYDRLIAHALRVTASGGLLVVAASSVDSRPEKLEKQIREAARDVNRRLTLVQTFGLPADFPTQMIHPQSRYLKCYFLIAD